nr:hypothetical protein [Tanacetum cinerariifolium]
ELQEVVEVVTTAKLITEVVIVASATIATVAPQLTTAAAPTLTIAPSVVRRRNGVVIRDREETTTPSTIIHSEAKSKDKGKGILRKEKEDNDVIRYQALKRKPQTEAQARKNVGLYYLLILYILLLLALELMLLKNHKENMLRVNTPRCDEDMIELMELTIFLIPSDEKVGIEVDKGVNEVHDESVHAAGVVAEGVVSAVDDVPTAIEEPSIPSPTPPTPPP